MLATNEVNTGRQSRNEDMKIQVENEKICLMAKEK